MLDELLTTEWQEKEALRVNKDKPENFHVTENQIHKVLNYFQQRFVCIRGIKDAGLLEEATRKLAHEIKSYKYHELRDTVYPLVEKLPANILF